MEQFDLRRRVAERSTPPLFAVPVTLVDPAIVEIVGFAGAEAMIIDAEHGTIGPETMRLMLAHARSTGIAAIYRPRSFDASLCRQALDMGAAGIHVPHVDTAEQARAIVQACRYPPLGHRQLGLARAIEYDVSKLRPYVARANESQLLVIMIESAEGLAKVEEISAVRGIDVIHVGTGDLSHDMGLTGQPLHAEVDAAVERIIEVAGKNGISVGYPTANAELVGRWTAKGVRFFEVYPPDHLLREAYTRSLADLSAAVARVSPSGTGPKAAG